MDSVWKSLTSRWQDGLNLVLGIWLIVSPWVLGFTDLGPAYWNAIVFGAIIALVAFAALVDFHEWEEWVDVAFGLWLMLSPWVLGFSPPAEATAETAVAAGTVAATWNVLVLGATTIVLAVWSLMAHRQGGTRAI